jgi:hypothetical protein
VKRAALAAWLVPLVAIPAHAAGPEGKEPATPPSISVSAAPIFGSDAATGNGWVEIVARIDNAGGSPQKGIVELASSAMYGAGAELETAARAPFNGPAGRTAIVKIPTHGFSYYVPQLTVTAIADGGVKLSSVTVSINGASGPLLVDVDQPPRLGGVLRGWPVLASWNPGSSGVGYASSALTVGAPGYDRTTGDPILPDRAAGYAAVTLLLVHSDALASLEEGKLDALVGWIMSGGTIGIIPSRPEDLRAPLLTTLLGGAATSTPPPLTMMKLPAYERPSSAPSIGSPPSASEDDPSAGDAPQGAPMQFAPAAPGKPGFTPRTLRVGPTPAVREKLAGYQGGNLRASDFGASAPYGSGEVHLLAFDPTASPMLEDAWVHSRVIDMVTRAWDRRSSMAFPLGGGDHGAGRMDEVRRALDPNENFRLGLGISAILLILYSLVAGPLTFMRAAKRGKPLGPLLWAPVWSGIAFGAIVLVGLAGKGWRGRSRHLSLVEASAGFPRATVRRYRGFFASEARSLAVAGTDRASVLEVAATDASRVEGGILRFDRNGVTLGELTSLPWQTVVVREDSFVDLQAGVTVWPAPDGSVTIVNRSGRVLKDVLVHVPGSDLAYITTIADGESAKSSDGRALVASASSPPRRTIAAGALQAHPLGARDIQALMGGRDGERVGNAWEPLENAAGDAIDWWPEGVPVVVGEIVGMPKAQKDAGLALESDRVMFRVVGTGGTP